jgi:hypothetical protein
VCRRAPPDRGWGFQDAPPLTDLLNLSYRSWWPNNMIPPLIKILAFAVDVRASWCHVTQPNQQRFCTPSFCEKHLNSESSDYLPLWPNGSDSIYILWIGGIAISSLYVNTLLLYSALPIILQETLACKNVDPHLVSLIKNYGILVSNNVDMTW